MKKIVVISGAGISAESGIKTFRDSNGLWENHDIMEVASPYGWQKNRALVLDFYNQRRKQLLECKPNNAHLKLAELQEYFDVNIITQNVDDLHERAGSKNVLHLHGELLKARSTIDEKLIYNWQKDITLTDKCEKGSQLRPHIVWFGESVPMLPKAANIVAEADILLVIGTSLVVYPAASLVDYTKNNCKNYIIDTKIPKNISSSFTKIEAKASLGIENFIKFINE
ncbi:MAG: NAD-dependent deacylase [Chitinophagales bacterium]